MKNSIKNIVITLILTIVIGTEVNASLIDRGLYTFDTETNLEWLDLTSTAGRSYNDISTTFGQGGEFEGWRYASVDETQILFAEFGFAADLDTLIKNPSDQYRAAQNTYTSFMGDLFPQEHLAGAAGITSDTYWLIGSTEKVYVGSYLSETATCQIGVVTTCIPELNVFLGENEKFETWNNNPYIGSFLVRASSIPEPSPIALLIFGLISLVPIRRKLSYLMLGITQTLLVSLNA